MTGIEWTDETWNPVVGCTRASRGCDNCYAVAMTHRLERMAEADEAYGRNPGKKAHYKGLTVLNPRGDRHFNGEVRCVEQALSEPLRWRSPRRVFVNSMADLFHPGVPFDFIDRVFAVMALTPQHAYQVLTKRPERMAAYFAADQRGRIVEASLRLLDDVGHHRLSYAEVAQLNIELGTRDRWPLPNVWLGTSCEDQAAADTRIPHLLWCPAAVRFLSCEPLLGPVQLGVGGCLFDHGVGGLDERGGLGWVIVGGESGKGARTCDVEWVRAIVGQCRAAGVPVFVKQLGACASDPENGIAGASLRLPKDAAALVSRRLHDPKGGDADEWPEELRVREFPA